MFWLIPAILFALFGSALLIVGLRGRLIDDRPICQSCKFDLVGVYPASQRCPECGNDLSHQRALRHGNRRVRRAPAILGAASLALGVLGGGFGTWASATGFDWNTVKPAWLLLRTLGASDDAAARDELLRRHSENLLSPRHRSQLIDQALTRHADPETNWDGVWDGYLQSLVDDDVLSDEQVRRILRQMVSWEASPRERIHADLAVPLTINMWPKRAPHFPLRSQGVAQPSLAKVIEEIRVNGEPISLQMIMTRLPGGTFTADQGRGRTTLPLWLELPHGEHTLEMTLAFTMTLDLQTRPQIEAEWSERRSATFEVVPDDIPLVREVSSPDIDEQIRSKVKLQEVQIRGQTARSFMVLAILDIDRVPFPLAMNVLVRDSEGHTISVTGMRRLTVDAHKRFVAYPVSLNFANRPARADLILRADERIAINMQGVEVYWDGEIIFPDFLPAPEESPD